MNLQWTFATGVLGGLFLAILIFFGLSFRLGYITAKCFSEPVCFEQSISEFTNGVK